MKISHILWIALLYSSISCDRNNDEKSSSVERPNILFIFADDQSFNTIHALGNDVIKTPNLDRLVDHGATFTQAFNMGGWNGAICVASRAMMFTGRTIWNAHEADSLMKKDQYDQPLWSQLFENEGYNTFMSGKWHITVGADQVFGDARHIRPGMPNQTEAGYNRPLNPEDHNWLPWDTTFGGFWKGGKHWSEIVADDADSFFDSVKASDDPFFMYLAFNAPHDPRQAPQEYVDMYPLENITMPPNFLEEYPHNEEMGSGRTLRDERLAPFPRTEHAVKVHMQEYYASISHMDAQIGKILSLLEASGEMDNTYIFFSADHGLSVGQHGLIGKQNMYEHSIRAPLIVNGPGISQAQFDTEVYIQDIMPTALAYANIDIPDEIEFNSLLPIIRGERSSSYYQQIFGCYTSKQRMVRQDDFKLIAYPSAGVLRLFNLEKDPFEMKDLANEPEYQNKKELMLKQLIDLQEEMNDPFPLQVSQFPM